jgi:pimeloyl-ACP methyl ester carboxylesterase/DNA-binding CsgD family transcriptional regulator
MNRPAMFHAAGETRPRASNRMWGRLHSSPMRELGPGTSYDLRMCKTADDVGIAAASFGKGPPLVRAAHWFSHVEFDAQSLVWSHWLEELSRGRTFVCYDQRGCGLSDWNPTSVCFEDWINDLERVVDAFGLERFALFGMSQGAAVAIAYAERYPERVSHLVLLGAYARGRLHPALVSQHRDMAATLLDLVRLGWNCDNPAFRQVFTTMLIPDGTREHQDSLNELARLSTSAGSAIATRRVLYHIDVDALARRLRVPTLVFHARGDGFVEFNEGRYLATIIPSARFVPLDSRNHVLLKTEPAWQHFLTELRGFLASPAEAARFCPDALDGVGLTPSEHEVLTFVASGLDNRAIAAALGKAEKTVRNQVSSIFCKLGVSTRAEAIVMAREAGMAAAALSPRSAALRQNLPATSAPGKSWRDS